VRAPGTRTRVWTVCLFFVATGPLTAEEAQPTAVTTNAAVDELRVLVEKLTSDNQRLTTELEQRETIIHLLTENLAVARTESELFQKRWSEEQLRAQALGVNFADDSGRQVQRQLVESVRALYLAEAERQQLVTQLQRLLDAVQRQADVTGEVERTRALLAATDRPAAGQPRTAASTDGALDAARVLEVNPNLRLVVLNIGLLQGARIGMPVVILRGDRVVAELKIVEVRRRVCGALIERVERKVTLQVGDVGRVTKTS
jgi:hypothetical protein